MENTRDIDADLTRLERLIDSGELVQACDLYTLIENAIETQGSCEHLTSSALCYW